MNYRSIILTILLSLLMAHCFGQGTDMGLERKPGKFIGFSAGSVKTEINHNSLLLTEKKGTANKLSVIGSLEFGYMISKVIGFRTGIGLNNYKTDLFIDEYSDAFNLKDDENDTYELRVTGTDINENESFKVIRIPLCFILNIPVSKVLSLFAEPDLGISLPLGAKYNSAGTFTYKGYYPEYNALLENLPGHKFFTDEPVSASGKPEMKKAWADISVFGGIGFSLGRKFQLKTGVRYLKSISGISDYTSTKEFHLSPASGQIISLMGSSSDVTAGYFGYEVALRYYLNR